MDRFAIIAIGASAGGLHCLREIVSRLRRDIPAAFFVVQHIGAYPSELPAILGHRSALAAVHAKDNEPIEAGRLYVAPPDHHLLIARGKVRLSRGPRQNWARPAIDPLFESAAEAYGPRTIGVLLSGYLSDGTAGLYHIKDQGGVAIVQDPREAAAADMPLSALRHVAIDFVLPVSAMPAKLDQLARELSQPKARTAEQLESR